MRRRNRFKKKVGILAKDVKKNSKRKTNRGIINPKLGVTEGQLRGQVRSALRKVWRNSARRVFIESVRFPYEGTARFKYAVQCVGCDKVMGQTQKDYMILKNGSKSKKKKSVYEVDHVTGNPEFTLIERDLGIYAHSLLYGELRILCVDCHKGRTSIQSKDRNENKRTAKEDKEAEADKSSEKPGDKKD